MASLCKIWSRLGKLDGDGDDAVVLATPLEHTHEGVVDVVCGHCAVASIFSRWMYGDFNLLEAVEAKLTIVETLEAGVGDGGLVVKWLAAGVEELNTAVMDALVHVNAEEALAVDATGDVFLEALAQEHQVADCVALRSPLGVLLRRMLLAERTDRDILVREEVG